MKTVLIAIFVFFASVMKAQTSYKGVVYSLNADNNSVSITNCDKMELSGDIQIPSKIKMGDKEYTVNAISKGAFSYCFNLESITIPKSVTSIGPEAFRSCKKLVSVQIPNSVNSIGSDAFRDCENLKTITIPRSVTSVGSRLFYGCTRLIEIHIHKNIYYEIEENVSGTIAKIYTDVYGGPKLLADKGKIDASSIPNIEFVVNSLSFIDQDGENTIKGGQNSKIRFQIKNSGNGVAKSCVAKVTIKGTIQDIIVKDVPINIIHSGETKYVEIPLIAGMNAQDGKVELAIQVDEPNGFGTDPQYITINTKAFQAPLVQITDYSITGMVGNTLKKKIPFDLQLMLQNTKFGDAEDVNVRIEIPNGVLLVEGEKEQNYNKLSSGDTKSLIYSLVVNNNYSKSEIPINVYLKEKHGKYSENKKIVLNLDQVLASSKITIEEKAKERNSFQIARLGSDVDKNIPTSSDKQEKTFAVVIANEHYQMVDAVPYASNDGAMFKAYLQQTLGLPESNIRFVSDATLNAIKFQIDWLKKVVEAHGSDSKAIVYYAGHGVPNEKDNTAYLLPIDGYVSDTSTGYSLEKLYQVLGGLPAKNVTLFLDACFSGARRDGKMLASARGVAIKAKKSTPQGKLIVLSAAQGDETAYPYSEQQHGLFTYYLLKKLQSSKGNVSMGELSAYVIQEVKRQSIITNNKIQTPNVNVAESLQHNWEGIMLK